MLASWVATKLTPLSGRLGYFLAFLTIYTGTNYFYSRITKGKLAGTDSFFKVIIFFMAFITVAPLFNILWSVWERGYKGLHLSLFTSDMHSTPTTDEIVGHGGLLHALVGTVLLVVVALLLSIPIAILTALYLTEIRGKFTRPIKFLVQSMSGVPSVVAGLFILASIVYPVTHSLSSWEGSLALAILMIPTIARVSEEVLLLVPNDLRESGVALGGTLWKTVQQIILPAARSGLVTAIILGVARIVGETAPIVLLTGGGDTTNFNIFHGPMGSLPFYIWKGLSAGTEVSIQRAWTGILVLIGLVLILFGIARNLSSRGRRK